MGISPLFCAISWHNITYFCFGRPGSLERPARPARYEKYHATYLEGISAVSILYYGNAGWLIRDGIMGFKLCCVRFCALLHRAFCSVRDSLIAMSGEEGNEKLDNPGRRRFVAGTVAGAGVVALESLGVREVQAQEGSIERPPISITGWLHPSPGTPEERDSEAKSAFDAMSARWDTIVSEGRNQGWRILDSPFIFLICPPVACPS